jgi:hypothetical protein
MTNIQQPEMRRSGHDRLVTDSAKERVQNSTSSRSGPAKDTRPAGQRSRYGPERADSGQAPDEGR